MSRSVLRTLLAASMEDDASATVVVEIEKEELSVSADLAISEIELVKDSVEVDAATDAAAELQDITVGLEALVAGLDVAAPNGTLSRQAANYFMISENYLSHRLGMESVSGISLESYGDDITVSTEGLKETLTKVFAARKEAFSRALKAMRDFFGKLFMSLKKVQGWVERYRKELVTFNGRDADGQITIKGGDDLGIDGKFDYASFRQGLQNSVELGRHFFGDYLDQSTEYFTMAASWITDNDLKNLKQADVSAMVEKFNAKLVSLHEVVVRVNTVQMSGGYFFYGQYGQTNTGRQVKLFKYEMARSRDAARTPSSVDIDLPSVSDLLEVLNDVETIAELAMNKKAALTKLIDSEEKSITDALTAIGVGESISIGTQTDRAVLGDELEFYTHNLAKPIHQYSSTVFASLRAALDVVDRSLIAYKKLPLTTAE